MKTVFKISPKNHLGVVPDLLIEVGWDSMSYLYYSKSPFIVEGLFVYHFERNITALDFSEELVNFFESDELPVFSRCNICYNFRESALIPASFYDEKSLHDLVDCIFGKIGESSYFSENITDLDVVLAYKVNRLIESEISKKYPAAVFNHSSAFQLPVLSKKSSELHCIVCQNSMKVFLFKNGLLQIATFFDYNSPSDAAYHLLNVCTQHDCYPKEITLTLSGYIYKNSNLYDEFYRYFMNIELDVDVSAMESNEELGDFPSHLFTHLISLAKCVS